MLLPRVLILFVFLMAGLMSGCASNPAVVDLSDSIYKINNKSNSERKSLSGFVLINKAAKSELINGLGSDTYIPISTATPTRDTVESDLRDYFENKLSLDAGNNRSLRVTIYKADSYWAWTAADKIPIFGLLFVGSDTEFSINLRVLFEVEVQGKVVASYLYDEKIIVEDKATTDESVVQSYKKLIAAYRGKFFEDLDNNFIHRYL